MTRESLSLTSYIKADVKTLFGNLYLYLQKKVTLCIQIYMYVY